VKAVSVAFALDAASADDGGAVGASCASDHLVGD
jgi:hypothetical protein